jgi:uncharacterized protein involved in response to NO
LPFAAKGFRPFFALAALYAVLIVPLWLAIVASAAAPRGYFDPLSWHAHEMLFGYAVAVIAGFLLTAVGNWTGRETLVGAPLLALAALWVLGRVAMVFAPRLPSGAAAAVDLAFLPVLIAALGVPLLATKNRRNLVLLALLALLFLMNLGMHLDGLGSLLLALRIARVRRARSVVLVILLIAGRVFPMFTATRQATTRSGHIASLDAATVMPCSRWWPSTSLLRIGESRAASRASSACLWRRAQHWGAWQSRREPLLWVLHAGYAWIVVGLVLRALSVATPASSVARDARHHHRGRRDPHPGHDGPVSLGHSGRPLVAPRAIRWAFAATLLRGAGACRARRS